MVCCPGKETFAGKEGTRTNELQTRRIPRHVWPHLAVMLLTQLLIFYPTRLLLPYLPTHSFETALDAAIPVRPEWIVIYYLTFVFWLGSAVLILSESPAYARRTAKGYLIAMLLSCVVFLVWPTTMTRPVPPDTGFFNLLLGQLYQIDDPVHLFPSLHVLITYFCIRAAMGSRIIPRWYFPASWVFLVLVCLCILFVKQHVLADIPSGILIGEISVQLARLGKERE